MSAGVGRIDEGVSETQEGGVMAKRGSEQADRSGLGTCLTNHEVYGYLHRFNASSCRVWKQASGAEIASYEQGYEQGYQEGFDSASAERKP